MHLRSYIRVLLLCASRIAASAAKPSPRSIIIDTDIFSDCDDVGALAVVNVLHNCGLADLKAVMINTQPRYGAGAVDTINTFYGNGGIPIGTTTPLTNHTFLDTWIWTLGEYASKLSHNYPLTSPDPSTHLSAHDLYLTTLQSSAPKSLTFISMGHLTTLSSLLTDPTAVPLLTSRVRELVIMGGIYPSTAPGLSEFNFGGATPPYTQETVRAATAKVLRDWPASIPITYVGFEVGVGVESGGGKWEGEDGGDAGPVAAAYEWYAGRAVTKGTARASWDLLAVLYGVLGLWGEGWRIVKGEVDGTDGELGMLEFANEDGWNEFDVESGGNRWVWPDEQVEAKYDMLGLQPGQHFLHLSLQHRSEHWLKLRDGVSNEHLAALLDRLIKHDPRGNSCPFDN